MPIKVPQHVIDNDVMLYGQCYIEFDYQQDGRERRIDPTKLRIVKGSSKKGAMVYKQEETSNIKGRLELRGVFEQLNRKQYGEMLGVDFSTNPSVNIMWEVLRQHGYMIVKPGIPSTVDDGMIALKRYEPAGLLEITKQFSDKEIEDFKNKWYDLMKQSMSRIIPSALYGCNEEQLKEEIKDDLARKKTDWEERLKMNPWLREQMEQTIEEEEKKLRDQSEPE